MARLLTASSLLIAFSLFSALQVGASPIPIPDHHSVRTEVKRDDVEIMKRDPLASSHEGLHELVARQGGDATLGLTLPDFRPSLTSVEEIIAALLGPLGGVSGGQKQG